MLHLHEERGQTLAEYAITLGVISVLIVAGLSGLTSAVAARAAEIAGRI